MLPDEHCDLITSTFIRRILFTVCYNLCLLKQISSHESPKTEVTVGTHFAKQSCSIAG